MRLKIHQPVTLALRRSSLRVLYLLLLLIPLLSVDRQDARLQADPARNFYRMINQARLDEGLPPLGWSTLLAQAAQGHADDMATNTFIDREGSDGSTPQQRIREAGYRAWNEGLMVNEAIWAGLGTADNALNWFRSRPEQWDMFTDSRYREVGVGHVTDNQGVNYFVLDFGSRPGVLPIFINDGAETTDSPVVAIRLTNEEAVPMGEVSQMGRAIEVRISDTPDFNAAPWVAWESFLPWTLGSTEPGDYAVYVEFRDGAGRTTISEDTIRLTTAGEAVEATPTLPPESEALTPLPTSTPQTQPQATVVPSPIPESPDTGTPSAVEPTPVPTYGPPPPEAMTEPETSPVPTWTPLPSPTEAMTRDEPQDWTLLVVLLLQGVAWLLGIALFLRRR